MSVPATSEYLREIHEVDTGPGDLGIDPIVVVVGLAFFAVLVVAF